MERATDVARPHDAAWAEALVRLPVRPDPAIDLWRIALDAAPPAALVDALSQEEHARAARFVFARDRRRYVAAHCAVRQLLGMRCGAQPRDLTFALNPFGKPRLVPPTCSFNLSDSGDVALLGIAGGEDIGVDVEVLRPVPDALGIAAGVFTPAEQDELRGVPAGPARDTAFLHGWSRKEACLKAVGSGLSIPPQQFHAGLAPQPRVVVIDTPTGSRRMSLISFRHGPDLIGATARLLAEGACA